MHRCRGSVLVLVIWMVVFFSIVLLGLASRGAAALSRTRRMMETLQASYLAQGALEQALTVLSADASQDIDGLNETWARPHRFDVDDAVSLGRALGDEEAKQMASEAVVWQMTDEERVLPLNTVSDRILERLLRNEAQLESDDARRLADCILDWRDTDPETRPEGAEDFYYKGRPEGYESKDGPFESVEELLLVRGVTPAVYARIRPHLTPYGNGRLNINTATEPALRALGISENGVSGVLAYRSGNDGQMGTSDDRVVGSENVLVGELGPFVGSEDLQLLARLVQQQQIGVGSSAFRVTVTSPSTHAGMHTLGAVITRDGLIEEWQAH